MQTAGPEAGPLYLYLPRWKSDGQIAVYADGRLLYQTDAKFLWNAVNLPLWIPLQGTAGAPAVREVQIRGQRLRHTGAAISSAWVGPSAAIGWPSPCPSACVMVMMRLPAGRAWLSPFR